MKRKKISLTLCTFLMGGCSLLNAEDTVKLNEVTVTADALKMETPLQETPRSVSIIEKDEINTKNPQKLDEALRYSSGVTAQPYGADNDTDWFKVRGFDAATYLDGNRLFRDGYYTWLTEPYGLEAIEIVKGPASILFGEGAPGGVVNLVTKKPSYADKNEIKLALGNSSHKSIGIDLSDSLNDSNSVRYRVVALAKNEDGELKGTENKRLYLAPSIEFDISDNTQLSIMSTFLKDDGIPTNPFFPAAGTLIDSNFGEIEPSTNLGQPDYDKYERTQFSLGYILEHQINDTWLFTQNANYGLNKLFLRSSYAFSNNNPNVEDLTQGIVFRDGENQSFTFDNNVVATWYSNIAEHILLSGIDLQSHHTKGAEQDNYNFGTINPFDPVYGNYIPLDSANDIQRDISKQQASVYSQYQLKLYEKWLGNIGMRYDWVKTENEGVSQSAKQSKSRDDGEFSLNAGLMYLAENGLSPYISYSQSFEVISVIDPTTNELYEPLQGQQIELGLKYQPSFFDGYINAAIFDIVQKNALVTNPNTWVATQEGEVKSRGVELELAAKLAKNTDFKSNYTFTDTKTDETSGQGEKQLPLIPRHQASTWLNHDPSYLLRGLKLGAGLRYIGETKDNPRSSTLVVPSALLWDASISYELTSSWKAQLNVNNILDKEYISACDYWCYYGQSRSVYLSMNYSW